MGRICRAAWAVARGAGLAVGISVAQVVFVRFVDPPFTLTMLGRVAEGLADGEGLRGWSRDVAGLEQLGDTVPRAVVASEDGRFFLHGGFDWSSVCDAVEARASGRRLRGASTISQQTAKNVFLWQGRSWVRKGLEVWYTALLELLVPKERILELYLNVAETGPRVFGVEAGAEHHFGKSARALSPEEAARLAGIFPDPRDRSVDGQAARERSRWIVANPAPFPGDRGFDRVSAAWDADWHGPWECLPGLR
ncbi:MAG: monofunctional biosynthetic peptidoglycan transglycosylase [Myxococcota bacterium]